MRLLLTLLIALPAMAGTVRPPQMPKGSSLYFTPATELTSTWGGATLFSGGNFYSNVKIDHRGGTRDLEVAFSNDPCVLLSQNGILVSQNSTNVVMEDMTVGKYTCVKTAYIGQTEPGGTLFVTYW